MQESVSCLAKAIPDNTACVVGIGLALPSLHTRVPAYTSIWKGYSILLQSSMSAKREMENSWHHSYEQWDVRTSRHTWVSASMSHTGLHRSSTMIACMYVVLYVIEHYIHTYTCSTVDNTIKDYTQHSATHTAIQNNIVHMHTCMYVHTYVQSRVHMRYVHCLYSP